MTNQETFIERRQIQINKTSLNLIVDMLKEDPTERYTIDQVLKHPWLNEEMAAE